MHSLINWFSQSSIESMIETNALLRWSNNVNIKQDSPPVDKIIY